MEKEKVKRVFKAAPRLDAEIRTITGPIEDGRNDSKYIVEYGIYESLGERGGDIITEFFDAEPTDKEIEHEIRERLKQNFGELKDNGMMSGREEMQLMALKRLRSKGAI